LTLPENTTCWVVTDGKAGMESQCLGLAESLGLSPVVKRVRLRSPWRQLSPWFRAGLSRAFADDVLAPPWPDLLFASGRLSVPASLYVRAQSVKAGKPTFTVQVQDPVIDPANFDAVVAPLHDGLSGSNVIATKGALHRVTAGLIAEGAQQLKPRLGELRRPYIGVLVGGGNGAFRLGPEEICTFASRLAALALAMEASLIVTPSRRTGKQNTLLLGQSLAGTRAFVWDGTGANPYFGILGLADQLVVTADSVNMITEACATGKPVHIYDLPGRSRKGMLFRSALIGADHARKFSVPLASYEVRPLREMDDVARTIEERYRTFLPR